MRIRARRPVLWLALVTFGVAIVGAACSSGDVDNDDLEALQQQVAGLEARITDLDATLAATRDTSTSALLLAVQPVFDPHTFHEINDGITSDGVIEPASAGFLQRALRTAQTLSWPPELEAYAGQLEQALEDLIEPVLDDDAEAAARPSTIAHGLAHGFEIAIEAYLAGDEVPEPPSLTADADHDEASEHDEHDTDADHVERDDAELEDDHAE